MKELVEVPGTTLPIYKHEENGFTIYEFDATECEPPEPMVNTLRAIHLLKNNNDRLIVTFFHEPFPLYEKIPLIFTHECLELENGDYKITFKIA